MQVRKLAIVGVLVLTTVAAATAAATPASAAAVVTVTPATGLQDGEVVQVHATNLTPGDTIRIAECGGDQGSCRVLASNLMADFTGEIDAPVVAHLVVRPPGGSNTPQTITCADDCSILVGNDVTELGRTDIRFAPGATPIDATPIVTPSTGLTDGQTVHVHVPAGRFDLGEQLLAQQCVLPVIVGNFGVNCRSQDVTASPVDASVDATVVVHTPFTGDDGPPAVDCRTTSCGIAVVSGRLDFVTTPVTFVAVVSTPSTPTTTVAPIVTATPRFTG